MFAFAINSLRSTAAAPSSSLNAPATKLFLTTTAHSRHNMGSRCIAVGTDMLSTAIHLQKARPWHRKITESNLAVDNAISLKQLFGGNKTNNNKIVGVFGIPAPFTGTCTCDHYPAYHAAAAALRQAGCDELVCYAVTDPYAHYGWKMSLLQEQQQQQQNNNNNSSSNMINNHVDHDITFLADPDACFAVAYGIDRRYDDYSLGLRSERFRMIVVDGIVTNFALVDNDAAAGDAQEMLRELQELQENNYTTEDDLVTTPAAAGMSS